MARFLDRLEHLMAVHGLARKRLSIAAGLGETAIRDIFAPGRQTVKLSTLVKLADHFGITLDELVGRDDENDAAMLAMVRAMPGPQRHQIRAMVTAFHDNGIGFKGLDRE